MNDFVRQMLRAWPLPVILAVVLAALGYWVGSTRVPTMVGQSGVALTWVEQGVSPGASFRDPLETLTPGYQGLAQSPGFLTPVLEANGISDPPTALVLSKRLIVSAPGPNLILVTLEGTSAQTAAATANAIAKELAATIEAEQAPGEGVQAEVLPASSSPVRQAIPAALMAIVGFLAGGVIGLFVLAAWVAGRRRIMSPQGLRLLTADRATDVGTLVYPTHSQAEPGNRALAVRLGRLIQQQGSGRSICLIGDDASAADAQAVALAAALRESDFEVVVADDAKELTRPDFATVIGGRFDPPDSPDPATACVILPLSTQEEDLMAAVLDRWAGVVVLAATKSKTSTTWLDELLDTWSTDQRPAVLLAIDRS